MPRGMLMPPIARGVIERSRWGTTAKWPVVTDIGPDVAGDCFALGQDRHLRIVTVQSLGGENMSLDQCVQRLQRGRAEADLISERRDAQIDSFATIAFALAIERLMLPKLLEQNHGEQLRSGEAAWRHVERRRWLRDRLAFPARELLAHGLDH